MTLNENNHSNLQELGGSDYEIADNQPDIRGWEVQDRLGNSVGEVEELIFDPQSLKVRYFVLDVDSNMPDSEAGDVLIPIGLAELHQSDDVVLLPIEVWQLASLPEYDKRMLHREYELSLRKAFAGLGLGAAGTALAGNTSEDFYSHDFYNEDNLYRNRQAAPTTVATEGTEAIPIIEEELQVGKRVVETGGARLRSRMVERPVEESINLREEHVLVERTPVNRLASEADLNAFQAGEIEIIEYAEVPVVSKEALVVEEISLAKEVEERQEVIRDTVRRTEVDVEDLTTDTDLNIRRTTDL